MGQNTGHKNLSPKQEKFCQLVASGINQSDAYRTTYNTEKWKPATIHREAKKMVDNPKISTRIADLGKPALEKINVTIEGELENLKLIQADAMKERDGDMLDRPAAIKATELLGKYLKMFVDRKETTINLSDSTRAFLEQVTDQNRKKAWEK